MCCFFFFCILFLMTKRNDRYFHNVVMILKQNVGLKVRERRFLKHNVGTVFGSVDF